MTTTATSMEDLLWRSEGEALDFKRDAYKIELGSDAEKAAFVKDVLAMANAWRHEPAFILIGVDEAAAAGPARVVGVGQMPDDAKLQQLVNGKTNRPIAFSCELVSFGGKQVSVVRIPCQQRPFFLKKDFGSLKAGLVYVRRGSSTAIADPDEIARMGAAAREQDASPVLEVQFAGAVDQRPAGKRLLVESLALRNPPTAVLEPFQPARTTTFFSMLDRFVNEDYAEELLRYTQVRQLMRPARLMVQNLSACLANGVRVQLDVPADSGLLLQEYLPARPSKDTVARIARLGDIAPLTRESHIDVSTLGDRSRLEFQVHKVQPKATMVSPVFFVGARQVGEEVIRGAILSAEGEPQETELAFELRLTKRIATHDDLMRATLPHDLEDDGAE